MDNDEPKMDKRESAVDKLTRAMKKVSIIAQTAQEEAAEVERARQYFVVIDFENVGEHGGKTGKLVNAWMLRLGCFNPRKGTNFLDELLDEGQSIKTHPIGALRNIAQMSPFYYGFWCVRPDFSVQEFYDWLAKNIKWPITVSVSLIVDNEMARFSQTFN